MYDKLKLEKNRESVFFFFSFWLWYENTGLATQSRFSENSVIELPSDYKISTEK
jgi:hypothetical protein